MFIVTLILPFLSFFINILLGRKLGIKGTFYIAMLLMLVSLITSVVLFYLIIYNKCILYYTGFCWFSFGGIENKTIFNFDKISSSMLLLVCTVSFFVHYFSYSYMGSDPHFQRFISYLSLFTFFMILLILSNSLILLFIGWEGVGICSYLLINFWFTRIEANKASIKAMVMNKIGDLGLLMGMIIIFIELGGLNYELIFSTLSNQNSTINLNLVCIFFLLGVIGKSAQFGLHTWLPDAMEGPTPVSALIHAATMVTAGVFFLIKMSPFFEEFSFALLIILLIGSLTSFFAGTVGLLQKDIKKIVAYSTCSQLGYMVTICGFSFYNLSLFHLVNHGFFKALLFLSCGSIIHALSDEQDIRKYGALKSFNPITYSCFLIGSLSLMGLPFLTGFYSKDLIIEVCYSNQYFRFVFWLSLCSAFFTSFYSLRAMYYGFFSSNNTPKANFNKIHESDKFILTSLITLSIFSITFGYIGVYSIMGEENHIPINWFYKNFPFFLLIKCIGIFWILVYFLKYFYTLKTNQIVKKTYYFFSNNWNFNNILNSLLFINIGKIGLAITYKLIDNQILEYVGPKKLHNNFINSSSYSSIYNEGNLYMYIFSIIACITFITIIYI